MAAATAMENGQCALELVSGGIVRVQSQNENSQPPPGVEFAVKNGGAFVKARAGAVGWQPIVGIAISSVWAAAWGTGLVRVIAAMRTGTAVNPGPAVFLCVLGAFSGIYGAALCLWTMIGHERLVISDGRLSITNPWLLGLRTRRFVLAELRPFVCTGKECGGQAEERSCCCRWSAVDYTMSFGFRGERIIVFPQLSPAAKDWLRDRMNILLRASAGSGV